jgi:excisionase family DNA binding protein
VSERLLTAGEVAERLAVPVSWIREATRSGSIPHLKLGRYCRYDAADVDAWLESCRHPGRPVAFRSVEPRRVA